MYLAGIYALTTGIAIYLFSGIAAAADTARYNRIHAAAALGPAFGYALVGGGFLALAIHYLNLITNNT